MSNEIIFFTQLASIIGFIVALFVLYRVLVNQKDAVIQLLKERNEYISLQLHEAKQQEPDVLIESLSNRAKLLENELKILSEDKKTNEEQITIKQKQLDATNNELNSIKQLLKLAHKELETYASSSKQVEEISRASLEHYKSELDEAQDKKQKALEIIEALQKRNSDILIKLYKYESPAYEDIAPLGGSVQPLRGTDSIMWTIKFRDGTLKRFKFPIRSNKPETNSS